MAALGRLREMAAQLRQPTSGTLASASALTSASASAAEEPIMVVVWSSQTNGGKGGLPREDMDAVRLIEEELGRPIKLWEWSPNVNPVLAGAMSSADKERIGSGSDELSAEEIEEAKAEVRMVLGKAVAWLGAPLGRWDTVKALVREECGEKNDEFCIKNERF